eukprot:3546380-Pleurochrysis_carterae.AAC.1
MRREWPPCSAVSRDAQVLESFELLDAFNVKLHVPSLGADAALRVLQHLGITNAGAARGRGSGRGAAPSPRRDVAVWGCRSCSRRRAFFMPLAPPHALFLQLPPSLRPFPLL